MTKTKQAVLLKNIINFLNENDMFEEEKALLELIIEDIKNEKYFAG